MADIDKLRAVVRIVLASMLQKKLASILSRFLEIDFAVIFYNVQCN